MALPYTQSGKCGGLVWQRNRYGQICYPLFVPCNPRTAAQRAVRGTFGAVSARWRSLTQSQRDLWDAAGRTKKSRYRLGRGPLTGFNYFVKVNVALVNRGLPQLDLPPGYLQPTCLPPVAVLADSPFNQPPIAATLYLQAKQLPHPSRAGLRQPTAP
jgi:hypothetical protein